MKRSQTASGKKKSGLLSVLALIAMYLLVSVNSPVLAARQAEENEAGTSEQHQEEDSPKKLKSRRTWETIINIPGAIVMLPFWLAYSGIKPAINFLESSKLISEIEDFLVSNDGRRMAYPTSRSRTGLGLKFTYSDFITRGDTLDLTVTLGYRWAQYYSLSLQKVRLGGQWRMTMGFSHQYLSTENYFGPGNDSRSEDLATYSLRESGGWISINAEPIRPLSFGGTLGLDYASVGMGRHPEYPSVKSLPLETMEEIPGLRDDISLASLNFHLQLDTVSRAPDAISGWMIFIKTGFFLQVNGGKYSFFQTAVDVRRHFHLFFDRSLVVRLAGMMTRPLDFGTIPFYMLSELGHRRSIRGFRLGRFRDRDKILGSLEYHFPLNKRPPKKISLNAYLFVDAGKVSSNLFHDSLLKGYHLGYGGGLRIFNRLSMDVHLIFAHSREGLRFALVINESEKSDLKMD
jgi:hypothetical protein